MRLVLGVHIEASRVSSTKENNSLKIYDSNPRAVKARRDAVFQEASSDWSKQCQNGKFLAFTPYAKSA